MQYVSPQIVSLIGNLIIAADVLMVVALVALTFEATARVGRRDS